MIAGGAYRAFGALVFGLWLLAGGAFSGARAENAASPPVAAVVEAQSHISERWLGGLEVELALTRGVPYHPYLMSDPMRLVVDFQGADLSPLSPGWGERLAAVSDVRAGHVRAGWSRLVLGLARPMAIESAGLETPRDGTGPARLRLALKPVKAAEFERLAEWARQQRPAGAPAAPQVAMPQGREAASEALRVMLDPGHGGLDPGAQRGGIAEKHLMLLLAQELRVVLEKAGFEVMLTRERDEFVALDTRVMIAQAARADVFISLHADALPDGQNAHGTTAYVLSDEATDAATAFLAQRHDRDQVLAGVDLRGQGDALARVLVDLARQDNTPRSRALARGVMLGIGLETGNVHKSPLRSAAFTVLRSAQIPSVLVEVGFLSDPNDLANLRNPRWRAAFARGLRDGLLAWQKSDKALARHRRK